MSTSPKAASALRNHFRGQKLSLIRAVGKVCEQLDRPVCSADLKQYFLAHPDERPVALKPLGAQLAHAARPLAGYVSHLQHVGNYRKWSYYAVDDTWQDKFRAFVASQKLEGLMALDIPGHLSHCSLDRYLVERTLVGWTQEVLKISLDGGIAPPRQIWADIEPRKRSLFIHPPDPELIDRGAAGQLLLREYIQRTERDYPLSQFRHLAMLRWPQSSLFDDSGEQLFWMEQVLFYAQAKWPVGEGNPSEAWAKFLCARYGLIQR